MFVKSKGREQGIPTVVSAEMAISGDLETDGDIQIDGVVDGDVKARFLSIGTQGRVTGAVACDAVTVHGSVDGTVMAKTITLCATARVKGDLIHDAIEIAKGAQVEGVLRRIGTNGDVENQGVAKDGLRLIAEQPVVDAQGGRSAAVAD